MEITNYMLKLIIFNRFFFKGDDYLGTYIKSIMQEKDSRNIKQNLAFHLAGAVFSIY